MTNKVSPTELSRHNKVDDLWLAVNGKVYDFTEFTSKHPGGSDGTAR